MGFGAEILFLLMLGLLLLGPKRLHTMLTHMARAKAEFEGASRGLMSRLTAELDAAPGTAKPIARMNQSGTSEQSTDTRYRNSEPAG